MDAGTTMDPGTTGAPTRWGRARGTRRTSAMAVAVPIGLVLAAGVGAISGALIPSPSPLLVGAAIGLATAAPLVALAWALLVERSSIRGALERPEESIESSWYDRAAQGAFSDLLLVVGLGTAALAVTGTRLDAVPVLLVVLLLATGSCAVRYLLARRRG